MSLVFVQCAMRAILNGATTVPVYDQTFDEHMKQYHPDPYTTFVERRALESEMQRRMYPEAFPKRRADDWRSEMQDELNAARKDEPK